MAHGRAADLALAALVPAATLAAWALGLDFVYDETLWQVLPAAWLRGEPLGGVLWALHAQPPAPTAIQWLDVNLLPGAMEASGLAAYAALVGATGWAARDLSGRAWAGPAAAAATALSPSAILYARFWFTTILCAALVAAFAALAAAGARRRSAPLLAASALPVGLASLFHAAFAPAAAALAVALAVLIPVTRARPPVVAALAGALALALAMPAKNWAAFGVFAPSSWGPANLATALSGWSAWGECEALIRRQPAPAAPLRGVEAMLRSPTEPGGAVNFNHAAMLDCARGIDLAAYVARGDVPANVAHNAFFALANPSWDYWFLTAANLRAVAPLIEVVDPLRPGGRPSFDHPAARTGAGYYWARLSPATLLLTGFALLAAASHLLRAAASRRDARADPAPALLATVYLSYLLVCLVANGVEMNRLRFAVFPLELGLLAVAARPRRPGGGLTPPPTPRPPAAPA